MSGLWPSGMIQSIVFMRLRVQVLACARLGCVSLKIINIKLKKKQKT